MLPNFSSAPTMTLSSGAKPLLALLAIMVLPTAKLSAWSFFGPERDPQVLIVSDAAKEIPPEAVPAPGKPVYYIVLGAQEYGLGGSTAGEVMPPREQVEEAVAEVLAKQGYLRTEVGGPVPALALLISWGEARLETWEYDETDLETGETVTHMGAFNAREIRRLVGADKVERHLLSFRDADEVNEAAREPRLYVLVAALDVEGLRQKKKNLLWRVRMSIPSLRNSLPDRLSLMLASAAPYVGRNVERPVFVDDAMRRRAEVELGTLEVVESDVNVPNAKKPADGK